MPERGSPPGPTPERALGTADALEAEGASTRPASQARRSASSTVLCPACGKAVDPLRAGHVALFEGGFHYFCDRACKVDFAGALSRQPEEVETVAPPAVALLAMTPPVPAALPAAAPVAFPRVPSAVAAAELIEVEPRPAPTTMRSSTPPASLAEPSANAVEVLPVTNESNEAVRAVPPVAASVVASELPPPVTLRSPSVPSVDLPLDRPREPAREQPRDQPREQPRDQPRELLPEPAATHASEARPYVAAAGLGAALVVPVLAHISAAASAFEPVALLACAGSLITLLVTGLARSDRDADAPGAVVSMAPALAAITLALFNRTAAVSADVARVEGEPDAAGIMLFASLTAAAVLATDLAVERIRARTKAKPARALSGRAPSPPPLVRFARAAVDRGVPIGALIAAVAVFAGNGKLGAVALAACAAAVALAARGAVAAVALHHARACTAARALGVAYKDGDAFDRAGRVDRAILCARGTVLTGQPEVVLLEPSALSAATSGTGTGTTAGITGERLVALAASAESARAHPVAAAVVRAAEGRGLTLEELHRVSVKHGLGVTAQLPGGERIVVGSRALLIQEHVSVALADARVTELEAQGRSVVLVAVAERVVGLLALQDGLCTGARAAVQRLLDAKIEPVLLSGDARETCEAVARALDVEHIRPELLPDEVAGQVRALAEGGHIVAAIGRHGTDDGALAAAGVGVALAPYVKNASGAQGAADSAVVVSSGDVRDAAAALTLPRACRDRARLAFALGVAPGVLAALAVAFAAAPLYLAPLAAMLGTVLALTHAQTARHAP